MNGRFSSPPFREGQLLQVHGQLLLPVKPPWWRDVLLVIAGFAAGWLLGYFGVVE